MSNDSHFGLMRTFVQREGIAMRMERPYAVDSSLLIRDTQTLINKIKNKQIEIQPRFDTTDNKIIYGNQHPSSHKFGKIRCRIVFDSIYIDSLARGHP